MEQIVYGEVSKIFCHKMFTMVLLDGIFDGFSNFDNLYSKIAF